MSSVFDSTGFYDSNDTGGGPPPPDPGIRTVAILLGDGSGPRVNMTGLSVSFHDEPSPNLTTIAKYQSPSQTTDATGKLTFSYASTLPIGGTGFITITGPGGYHFAGGCVVS